jgi:hypothetical protein
METPSTSLEIQTINSAVTMAEELVSNYYKLSANQWLRLNYDIQTLPDLSPEEIVDGPFAQIVRYHGQRKNTRLGTSGYDFYKICIQDHTISAALEKNGLALFPFSLYVITHELVHIVRFKKFLQNFDASPEERLAEETRVHAITHQILIPVKVTGLAEVLEFYRNWHTPMDHLQSS